MVQGGVDYETISDAIKQARKIHKEDEKLPIVPDYDVDDVSAKVVEYIKKYVDVVNKETWLK
jgi:UDP-N-acetylglucosamine 2-epimerase